MSLDANKQLVRRFIEEAWHRQNLEAITETHSPDLVLHGGQPPTIEGLRNRLERMHGAFSDIRIEVEDQVAEADRVATRMTATATHTGPFMGVEPTHRQVTFEVMDFVQIADGKITEQWDSPNFLSLLGQLGALPAPA